MGRGEPCRLVASQPRRLAATAIAERVAAERGGSAGGAVGYKVRFEERLGAATRLAFVTVGVLLKAMQSNPLLSGATHIIVDEVHERDVHTDFLLLLLRDALAARDDLRLVLMSATVDPSSFQAYFPGAKTLRIPGTTNFPIEEIFLEALLPQLPPTLAPAQQRAAKPSAFAQGPLPGVPLDAAGVALALPACAPVVAAEIARRHGLSAEEVDLDLICRVVAHIEQRGEEGAVLIFCPGWFEIGELIKRLGSGPSAHRYKLYPLHSRMPTAEQREIFQPPPPGLRKIIVSTVIAETSVTVEDVVFVVDPGRTKLTCLNEASLVSALRTGWYSKASGLQRRGRAGRCREGVWFRLYSSLQWAALDEYSLPEMLRTPLDELCLEIGSLRLGPPQRVLAKALSPPPPETVAHAIASLHVLGALADEEGARLSTLGVALARLAVHPKLGKLLLLSSLFRCVQPLLTVCAGLGYKSPFLCPLGKEREADQAKRDLAGGSGSDHIALVRALDGWREGRHRFASRHFLSPTTLEYISRLRRDLADGARELLTRLPADHASPAYLHDMCRAVLVAGLNPNVACLRRFGKGDTLSGLKVTAHPGSVNSRASSCVVVFFDVQETTERYMYDTSVVSMAPLLLFAPALHKLHATERRVTFGLGGGKRGGWRVAVDAAIAEDLLALRELLSEFVQRSVGQPPTAEHWAATDALGCLFSDHAPIAGMDDDDNDDEDGGAAVAEQPAVAVGRVPSTKGPQ